MARQELREARSQVQVEERRVADARRQSAQLNGRSTRQQQPSGWVIGFWGGARDRLPVALRRLACAPVDACEGGPLIEVS